MARKKLILELNSEQKEKIKAKIGLSRNNIVINPKRAIVMKYGYAPDNIDSTTIIMLTDSQKQALKKEFNSSCEYIEISKKLMK